MRHIRVANRVAGSALALTFSVIAAPAFCQSPAGPPQSKTPEAIIDEILKNKQPNKAGQTSAPAVRSPPQSVRPTPAVPNLAAVVTPRELAGVRSKIRPCWFTQKVPREQDLVVAFVVQMNRDGTPVHAEIENVSRYNSDPAFRIAADAAHRAIMNPRCQPWPLSPATYGSWETIVLTFDPRDG